METLLGISQEKLLDSFHAMDMNDTSRVPNKCCVFLFGTTKRRE